jgi:hypothetical protein
MPLNLGIKSFSIKFIRNVLQLLHLHYFIRPLPIKTITVNDFLNETKNNNLFPIKESEQITETPPIIIGHHISNRFKKYYKRNTLPQFVLKIENGCVMGKDCNFILTEEGALVEEVSREFGQEGGKVPSQFSVLNKLSKKYKKIKKHGKVAVLSTSGSANFHHWNYDVLPRFESLKKANLLEHIDYFLINYNELPFQKEALQLLGIKEEKIINTKNEPYLLWQFDVLYVPSLTQSLSTISPSVIAFIRNTFLKPEMALQGITTYSKIFLSRKNVLTRKIINEQEVMEVFQKNNFVEVYPENYNMQQMAFIMSKATVIASVHGSGLSNLPFINEGTKVLDILAPRHQDPYYWMICNQRKATYVGLFAEGEHPLDTEDLVINKIDNDLLINLDKLNEAIQKICN